MSARIGLALAWMTASSVVVNVFAGGITSSSVWARVAVCIQTIARPFEFISQQYGWRRPARSGVKRISMEVIEVRRRVTVDTTGKRGTAKDPIRAERNRLLRGYDRLSAEQFNKMWNGLIDGDPSGQILSAWVGKEELRRLLATARAGGTRHDVAHRLVRFNSWCANSSVPELERLASTYRGHRLPRMNFHLKFEDPRRSVVC